MFYNPLLNETLCKSTKWPALHYVHQNPKTGEWVASDNRVLLAELNGAIPMFEMWDSSGNPANTDLTYDDYEGLINRTVEAVDKSITLSHIKYKDVFAFIGELPVLKSDLDKVVKFIGTDCTIKFKDVYTSIYFISSDKQRRALIMPLACTDKWRLLDTDESLIGMFNSWQEAHDTGEMLGCEYIIKPEVK